MDSQEQNCEECGKKLLTREFASITQWMFNSEVCNCRRLTNSQSLKSTVTICSICGKRKNTTSSGSMTQWIFGEALCSCQKPETPSQYLEDSMSFEHILPEKETIQEFSDKDKQSSWNTKLVVIALVSVFTVIGVLCFSKTNTSSKISKTAVSKQAELDSIKRDKVESSITMHDELSFPNAKLDDTYLKSLSNGKVVVPSNLDLSMSNITDDGLKYLVGLPIETLDLRYTDVSDEGMEPISKIQGLSTLILQGCKISPLGLEKIVCLSNLDTINLSGISLSDDAMAAIAKLKSLRKIFAAGSPDITPNGLNSLTKIPNLNRLYLRGSNITDEHLKVLSKYKSLVVLSLKDNKITDDSIDKIVKLKKLKILRLSGNEISDSSLLKLSDLPYLNSIELANIKSITRDGIFKFKSKNPRCVVSLKAESAY